MTEAVGRRYACWVLLREWVRGSCVVGVSLGLVVFVFFFFFQAEDGIRDVAVTGVQTCALPISQNVSPPARSSSRHRGWWWSAAFPPASACLPTASGALRCSVNLPRCIPPRHARPAGTTRRRFGWSDKRWETAVLLLSGVPDSVHKRRQRATP